MMSCIRCSSGRDSACNKQTHLLPSRIGLKESDLEHAARNVEDLWLSYFASHVMGNSLIAAPDLIRQVKDGKDQYIALREKKDVFLEWLRTKGEWYV